MNLKIWTWSDAKSTQGHKQNRHSLTLLIMIWQCKPHMKQEQVNYTDFAQKTEQVN